MRNAENGAVGIGDVNKILTLKGTRHCVQDDRTRDGGRGCGRRIAAPTPCERFRRNHTGYGGRGDMRRGLETRCVNDAAPHTLRGI